MPADADRSEVLTSLPRSRPQRRSAKRGGGGDPSADGEPRASAPAAASTPAKPRAAKPRPRPAGAAIRGDEPTARPVEPPSGGDVLQSAVRAAGELAQVGATISREALKSVLSRLRP